MENNQTDLQNWEIFDHGPIHTRQQTNPIP